MHRPRWAHIIPVVGVLLLLLLPSGGAISPRAPPHGAQTLASGVSAGHAPSPAALGTKWTPPNPTRSLRSGAPPSGLRVSPEARAAEQQIAAGRFAARNALLPARYVAAGNPASSPVIPLQQGGPVPMGLADLGLGGTGAQYGYEYNTSAFAGTIHLSSFAVYNPGYPALNEAPDWASIQLNTVGVNLTYPNETSATFWFQNAVHINGTTLQFEDNIWNFSAPQADLPVSPFYSHATGGSIEAGLFYYDYDTTSYTVSYPLTITLTNQLAIVGGRPTAFFNFSLTDPSSGTTNASYDEVMFKGPASASAPPQFRVSGLQYNPENSEYDAELIIGGDGGGTNANVIQAEGTMSLGRWMGGHFQSVPSAFDYGVDSGETSTGLAAYYEGTTEYIGQGPSLLYGLWNTTSGVAGPHAAPGYIQVNLTVTPAYAFVFATNATANATTLVRANLTPAPATVAGVVRAELPPPAVSNPYVFAAWADGYQNQSITVTGNLTAPLVLSSAPTLDAPIYLNGDSQAVEIGGAGVPGIQYSGTGSHATLWINQSTDTLAPPFRRVNDYAYPEFVLFAALRVNLTVRLDGFLQNKTSFNYSFWNATASGVSLLPIPGWTQSYGFFYGTGGFSVTNTTVTGNTTLDYEGVYSPGAVEFYDTNGSHASGIGTGQESLGVDAVAATNVALSNIHGETGADAVTLVNSSAVTGTEISGNGTDYKGFPTWGIDISGGSKIVLTEISATNESTALVTNGISQIRVTHLNASGTTKAATAGTINATTDLTVQDMDLTDGSTGLSVNASSTLSLSNISVAPNGYAGNISDSSGITISNLSVVKSAEGGFDFWSDVGLSLNHGSAVGATSTVISSFIDSHHAVVANVTADDQAWGLLAVNSSSLSIHNLIAANGSIGAVLTNMQYVNATGVSTSNGSIGVDWNVGSVGHIRSGTVGTNCTGVSVANVTGISVAGFTATESALVAPYFLNPLNLTLRPVAPVAFYNDTNASVANISADEFPFAVWENYTNASVIQNVTAWNALYGIQVNASVVLTISRVFLQNNLYGMDLNNVTHVNVTGSTFEDSGALGLNATNDSYVHVYGNNFVANNNSSTSGTFSSAHEQVYVNNSTVVHFNSSTGIGNYWSDHTGSGAYVIRTSPTVQDSEPQPAFISNYLRFVAVGLPSLTPWGFQFPPVLYSTYAALVYIPAWTLASTSYGYTVHPPLTYVPTPASGTVAFTGADENVTIVFSHVLTFTASGLPSGTTWQIVFNGTTESASVSAAGTAWINLTVLNGKYTYSLEKVPGYWQTAISATGSITVAGANLTEALAYVPFTYAVNFQANGLPSSTAWSIVLGGKTLSSTNGSIVVELTNGSYPYTVNPVSGYSIAPESGTVEVSGGKVTVTVTFSTPSPTGPSPWIYAGIGAAVVAVLLGIVLMARRRRPAPPPRDEPLFR